MTTMSASVPSAPTRSPVQMLIEQITLVSQNADANSHSAASRRRERWSLGASSQREAARR